jgi:hypothetical protein
LEEQAKTAVFIVLFAHSGREGIRYLRIEAGGRS